MGLVDDYGDVPYFEAGKAVSEGVFYPKYDDDAAIYDDLYKELKEAIAALILVVNLFLLIFSMAPMRSLQPKPATAADQVAKWKKLGNSLLLS